MKRGQRPHWTRPSWQQVGGLVQDTEGGGRGFSGLLGQETLLPALGVRFA